MLDNKIEESLITLLEYDGLNSKYYNKLLSNISDKQYLLSDNIHNFFLLEEIYENNKFDENQKEEIRSGFAKNLKSDEVKLYMNEEFSFEKMRVIKDSLIDKNNKLENIAYAISLSESAFKTKLVIDDLRNNLTKDEINVYIDKRLGDEQTSEIRKALFNGVNRDYIQKISKINFTKEQIKSLREYLELNIADDYVFNLLNTYDYSGEEMKFISKIIYSVYNLVQVNNPNYNFRDDNFINFIFDNKFNYKQLEVFFNNISKIYNLSDKRDVITICKANYHHKVLDIILNLITSNIDSKLYIDVIPLQKLDLNDDLLFANLLNEEEYITWSSEIQRKNFIKNRK